MLSYQGNSSWKREEGYRDCSTTKDTGIWTWEDLSSDSHPEHGWRFADKGRSPGESQSATGEPALFIFRFGMLVYFLTSIILTHYEEENVIESLSIHHGFCLKRYWASCCVLLAISRGYCASNPFYFHELGPWVCHHKNWAALKIWLLSPCRRSCYLLWTSRPSWRNDLRLSQKKQLF